MPINFPGPYEVRLFYTTVVPGSANIQHSARYNCDVTSAPDPGEIFDNITVLQTDAVATTLKAAVDGWVTLIKPLWLAGAAAEINYAELWKYTAGSFDAEFVSVYNIAVAATGASANVAAGQNMITFRTDVGGIMKINFLETAIGPGVPDTLPFTNVTLDAIADSILANDQCWIGRDNGKPFACIAMYPGTNEALFKRRFR